MNPTVEQKESLYEQFNLYEQFKNDPEFIRMNKRIAKVVKKAKQKQLMLKAFKNK